MGTVTVSTSFMKIQFPKIWEPVPLILTAGMRINIKDLWTEWLNFGQNICNIQQYYFMRNEWEVFENKKTSQILKLTGMFSSFYSFWTILYRHNHSSCPFQASTQSVKKSQKYCTHVNSFPVLYHLQSVIKHLSPRF